MESKIENKLSDFYFYCKRMKFRFYDLRDAELSYKFYNYKF